MPLKQASHPDLAARSSDLNGLVTRARGDTSAVGRESHGVDFTGVPLERPGYTRAAACIPHQDGLVVRARGNERYPQAIA